MATIWSAWKGILVQQLATQEATLVKPMVEGGVCLVRELIQQRSAPNIRGMVKCSVSNRVIDALVVW